MEAEAQKTYLKALKNIRSWMKKERNSNLTIMEIAHLLFILTDWLVPQRDVAICRAIKMDFGRNFNEMWMRRNCVSGFRLSVGVVHNEHFRQKLSIYYFPSFYFSSYCFCENLNQMAFNHHNCKPRKYYWK